MTAEPLGERPAPPRRPTRRERLARAMDGVPAGRGELLHELADLPVAELPVRLAALDDDSIRLVAKFAVSVPLWQLHAYARRELDSRTLRALMRGARPRTGP